MVKLISMKKIILFFAGILLATVTCAQDRTDSLHIAHYDINLNITDFANHVVYGYADLTAVAKVNALPQIDLDLKQLVADSVRVEGEGILSFTHEGTLLRIPLQTPANQGDTLHVRVYYSGVPGTDSYFGGFYFSGEYCYNIGVAFRDLPHNFGRGWYPCLDFFTDKSTYTFNIETEANKRAICGGYLRDSIVTDSNTIIWQWQLDEPVPTYLTSVAVGNYMHYADTVQGMERVIPIDIYTYPEHFSRIPNTFANLKNTIHIYEMRYGPYRWNRIGYVGVNFNAGAMEHVTNIAYPNFAISGNTSYETLYMHELSHMWFGDLITCQSAEDMWLNEGFANYSEFVVAEILYPSNDPDVDGYKAGIRDQHRNVLKKAHTDDGGYWALNQIPQDVTYGTTTYDKGGIVVHTLRKYMGDSVFFDAIRAYLTHFSYQNVSSEDFFGFMSQHSGQDLQDFFEGWVAQPGFLHFSVDSVRPTGNANEYRFFVRQRLSHANYFANSNKIDITFFSADNQNYTIRCFTFDGEFAEGVVTLPFIPVFAVVDLDEKLADAIVDYNILVTSTGTKSMNEANVRINVTALADTAWVRVEDNYVAPDPLKEPNEHITALSSSHFWRIEATPDRITDGRIRFIARTSATGIDYELFNGHAVSELQLLYRRDPSEDWQIIHCSKTPGANMSYVYIVTDDFRVGEYTLAIGTYPTSVRDNNNNTGMSVYPNPASESLTVQLPDSYESETSTGFMYDAKGNLVRSFLLQGRQHEISTSDLPAGVYILKVSNEGRRPFSSTVSIVNNR